MSEDQARSLRQRKRTSASRRFVAPDNVPVGQAWIGAPPKLQSDQGAPGGRSSPPPPPGVAVNPYEQVQGRPSQYGAAAATPPLRPAPPSPPVPPRPPAPPVPPPQPGIHFNEPRPAPVAPQQVLLGPGIGPGLQPKGHPGMQQGHPGMVPAPGVLPPGAEPHALRPGVSVQGPTPVLQAFQIGTGPNSPGDSVHAGISHANQQKQPQMPPVMPPVPPVLSQAQAYAAIPRVHEGGDPGIQGGLPQHYPQEPSESAAQYPLPTTPKDAANSAQFSVTSLRQTLGRQKTGIYKTTGGLKKPTGHKKPRAFTKSWHWPDSDEYAKPDMKTFARIEPLGLLPNEEPRQSSEVDSRSTFAQAIKHFETGPSPPAGARSEQFDQLADEIAGGSKAVSDLEARTALDRLARSLSSEAAGRELAELAPRIAHLIKANSDLLLDLIELCRACQRSYLQTDTFTKLFEQLNRLFDAAVLPARRDLAVEHFVRAAAASIAVPENVVLTGLQLSEHMLLSNHPDRAAELLLAVLSSGKVNNEELSIRAFKFDRDRAKNVVRVWRDALEPEAAMRSRDNILQHNYFSHLFSSIAINAAIQASNSKARYARRRGQASIYEVKEEEVKPGLFRVVHAAAQEFVGLSYDEIAWVNRQFAGQRLRGHIPSRLNY